MGEAYILEWAGIFTSMRNEDRIAPRVCAGGGVGPHIDHHIGSRMNLEDKNLRDMGGGTRYHRGRNKTTHLCYDANSPEGKDKKSGEWVRIHC